MIDLSALGLPTAKTSQHGGKQDKAGASQDHGKQAKSFGDLVSEAGKKLSTKMTDVDDDANGTPDTGKLAAIDDLQSLDLADLALDDELNLNDDQAIKTDLLKPETAKAATVEPESRVRLSAGFQQLMKSSAESGVLRQAEAVKAEIKAEVKNEKSENNKEQKLDKDDVPAAKDKVSTNSSKELHALLGLAPAQDDADEEIAEEPIEKTSEKAEAKLVRHDNDDIQVTDPKLAEAAGPAVVKADAALTQQVVAQHAVTKAPVDAPVQADADDAKTPAQNDVDKVRVVSNDGKGRPVDIELAKTAVDDSTEPATGGKVDFVTVLDSRRYLGFSNDSNASALTNAIKAEPSWAQVIHAVNTGADRTATEVNTLKLQMSPEHLGNMTASLRLKGDELSVEVRVESVEAYRQLTQDQDGIVKALKDQGFAIDQVSIQLSPSARADAGNTSQNNGNQSQQDNGGQNLQERGQGDNARQRDESARRNSNQNNWMGNDRTSSFSDSGSGSDNTDTGNLYL